MTTHVFIVDATTFKLHLEYLFAGTGAKNHKISFNNSDISNHHHSIENMLTGMMADAGRIRAGDQIIFYLQQDFSEKIFEGKFFGMFKAKENFSFLDNNDGNQYLINELGKSLTLRTLIEPETVYAEGVTEWEALDEIRGMTSPNQMLWSLIYRKLKGNRGNTMITIYEAERLCQLIRNKNRRSELAINGQKLTFDRGSQKITLKEETVSEYAGRKEEANILPRLISKHNSNLAFESHLQAYIVQNIGKNINQSLDRCILGGYSSFEWLGNEVSCGVGMQRIDVMLSVIENGQRVVLPIELKAVEADLINAKQIQRYVDWIEQYYIPNRQSDIRPMLIAKKTDNKDTGSYTKLIESLNNFNRDNSSRCEGIKYIEYHFEGNDLFFEVVNY